VRILENPFLSVVIPAFNEEANLGFVLLNAHKVLKNLHHSYEIIVVNDGSNDSTADVASINGVILINNKQNLGKGGALKAGFVRARGSLIITMDADGSHLPQDIPNLIYPFLNGYDVDVTIGSRFMYQIGKNSTTKLHLIGNRIINFIILLLTGRFISDSQSGFRAFKKYIIKNLRIISSGYDIESEVLIKLLKKGYKVQEVPIWCQPRSNGFTYINPFKDGFNIVRTIIKATFYSLLY